MRTAPPLRVDFDRSRWTRWFLGGAFGATGALVAALPLDVPVRAFALLLVAALFARAWRQDPPAGIVLRLDGTLAILERDGRALEASLMPGGYTGSFVTTIVARAAGERRCRAWLVLPDMLPRDDYRRLRVRLRYSSSADDDDSPASQARASSSAALSALGCPPIR